MRYTALVALLIAPPVIWAQDYPAPVQAVIDQGVRISAEFDAPGGLTGYVGRIRGQPITIYLLPGGEHVVVGSMFDASGRDISDQQLARHLPPPDLEPAWEQLDQAHWIAEGAEDPERVVYTFTDPNCPYCQRLWEAAQPYLQKRDIQLRHVVVGILAPSSVGKAARILGADDSATALVEHQSSFADGGLDPLPEIPEALRRQVEEGNRLMQRLDLRATPVVFYRDREGRVRKQMGLPDPQLLEQEVFR